MVVPLSSESHSVRTTFYGVRQYVSIYPIRALNNPIENSQHFGFTVGRLRQTRLGSSSLSLPLLLLLEEQDELELELEHELELELDSERHGLAVFEGMV